MNSTIEDRDKKVENFIIASQDSSVDTADLSLLLWDLLYDYEGYTFHTVKGLEFTFHIKGHELFIDRKEKSITLSSLRKALSVAKEYNFIVSGPKVLGIFGASYIYPILLEVGIIRKIHNA